MGRMNEFDNGMAQYSPTNDVEGRVEFRISTEMLTQAGLETGSLMMCSWQPDVMMFKLVEQPTASERLSGAYAIRKHYRSKAMRARGHGDFYEEFRLITFPVSTITGWNRYDDSAAEWGLSPVDMMWMDGALFVSLPKVRIPKIERSYPMRNTTGSERRIHTLRGPVASSPPDPGVAPVEVSLVDAPAVGPRQELPERTPRDLLARAVRRINRLRPQLDFTLELRGDQLVATLLRKEELT